MEEANCQMLVQRGDTVFGATCWPRIETDKATMEFEAVDEA